MERQDLLAGKDYQGNLVGREGFSRVPAWRVVKDICVYRFRQYQTSNSIEWTWTSRSVGYPQARVVQPLRILVRGIIFFLKNEKKRVRERI